jgi:hypothetical protein
MKQIEHPHSYQGGNLIGFILTGVVALRVILFYQGQSTLYIAIMFTTMYALLYSLEPWLSKRFPWHGCSFLQTAFVITLPSASVSDFQTVLYSGFASRSFVFHVELQ